MSEQSNNNSSTPKKKDTIFKIKQSPKSTSSVKDPKDDSPIKIVEDPTSPERKKRKIIISKSKLAVAAGPKKETNINKNQEEESSNKRYKKSNIDDEYDYDMDMDIEDDLDIDNDDIDMEIETKPLSKSKMTSRQRAMVYGELDEPLLALENYSEPSKPKKSTSKEKKYIDKNQPSQASLKEIYEVINQLLVRQSEKKEKVEVQEKPTFNENYIRVTSNKDGKFVSFPPDVYEKIFENWTKKPVNSEN